MPWKPSRNRGKVPLLDKVELRNVNEQKRILVVDDDPYMRVFLSTALETSGHTCISCKDGREGMQRARELLPSLIILDIMMPNEGGLLMYRGLKTEEALKRIPVVMLSGVEERAFLHSLKMLRTASQTGLPEPDGYLEKPPKAEELLEMVKVLLGKETSA